MSTSAVVFTLTVGKLLLNAQKVKWEHAEWPYAGAQKELSQHVVSDYHRSKRLVSEDRSC